MHLNRIVFIYDIITLHIARTKNSNILNFIFHTTWYKLWKLQSSFSYHIALSKARTVSACSFSTNISFFLPSFSLMCWKYATCGCLSNVLHYSDFKAYFRLIDTFCFEMNISNWLNWCLLLIHTFITCNSFCFLLLLYWNIVIDKQIKLILLVCSHRLA